MYCVPIGLQELRQLQLTQISAHHPKVSFSIQLCILLSHHADSFYSQCVKGVSCPVFSFQVQKTADKEFSLSAVDISYLTPKKGAGRCPGSGDPL
jgi:hypothetical protein